MFGIATLACLLIIPVLYLLACLRQFLDTILEESRRK